MNNNITIPVSIIIAGAFIAGAVVYTNKTSDLKEQKDATNQVAEIEFISKADAINPVDDKDWIYGNKDSKIQIVEYSDTECPFCGRLHKILKQIVDENKTDVSWVYRHFPIEQMHSKAVIEAHATECVGELAGNDVFWNYINRIFEETPANNKFDLDLLPKFAKEIGVNEEDFNKCMAENRHKDKVSQDFNNALELTNNSLFTPYSVILLKDELSGEKYQKIASYINQINTQAKDAVFTITSDKKKIGVRGALPYDIWNNIIKIILTN